MQLPERGLALVHIGQPVKLLYDAFPYERYGVQYGTLTWLSPASSAGPRGPMFRAFAELGADTVGVQGTPRSVLPGMTGRAAVIVGQRTLVSYALEPLRQMRESLSAGPPMAGASRIAVTHGDSSRTRAYDDTSATLADFYTSDTAMQACLDRARVAAQTDLPILILGESGAGKTILARAIHNSSRRNHGPFVSFNAAALSDTLLDSQLFGHERGAFTGAHQRVKGKFELAHQGTLFLDEIADLSPTAQSKILRAVEYRRVRAPRFRHAAASRRARDQRDALGDQRSGGAALPSGSLLPHQRLHVDAAVVAGAPQRSSGAAGGGDRARRRATGKSHRRASTAQPPIACLRTPGRETCVSCRRSCTRPWRSRPGT